MNSCAVSHPIPPVYDSHSRILILGSFPSVKSRENGFFYGHSRNRFWKTASAVIGRPEPKSIEEKKKMLLDSGIALWDVIASCEISASSDSSIKNAVPNDISCRRGYQKDIRKRQNRREILSQIHFARRGH